LVQYVARAPRRLADWWLRLKRLAAGRNVGMVFLKPGPGGAPPPVVEDIRRRISLLPGQRPDRARFAFLGSDGSLVCDLETVVVRLPLNPRAAEHCAVNYGTLTALRGRAGWDRAPRPITHGTTAGQTYYAESHVGGRTMDDHRGRNPRVRAAIYEQALELLMDRELMFVEQASPETVRALVLRAFDGLLPFVDPDDRPPTESAGEAVCRGLGAEPLPLVVHHGDFKFSNFRYQPGRPPRLTGIVDWDRASVPGFPVLDLLTLTFDAQGHAKSSIVRSCDRLAREAGPLPAAVERYRVRWELSPTVVRQLARFCVVKYLGRYYTDAEKATDEWRQMVRATLLHPGR
jgi:hypothetical protein